MPGVVGTSNLEHQVELSKILQICLSDSSSLVFRVPKKTNIQVELKRSGSCSLPGFVLWEGDDYQVVTEYAEGRNQVQSNPTRRTYTQYFLFCMILEEDQWVPYGV